MLKYVAAAAAAAGLAASGVAADNVMCPNPRSATSPAPGTLCGGVFEALNEGGHPDPADAMQVEEVDEVGLKLRLTNPGDVQFSFQYRFDGGQFMFTFGFCLSNMVPADIWAAATDTSLNDADRDAAQFAFAQACVGDDRATSFMVFDDSTDDEGAQVVLPESVRSPASVVFWLLPNTQLSSWDTSASDIWANNNGMRRPLFSTTELNAGNFDHFAAFDGIPDTLDRTFFLFEDKDRSPNQDQSNNNDRSDSDLGDITFGVNAVITPDIIGNFDFFCDPEAGGVGTCTDATKTDPGTSVTMSFGPDDLAQKC